MDSAIALLAELVAINSVNPSLVPGAPGETQIADAIAAHSGGSASTCEMQDVAPGRPNVIGVLEGRAPGPIADVLRPHRHRRRRGHVARRSTRSMRDGRLYGRGSQDMKGGVAAMIDAARVVAAEGLPTRPADRRRGHRRGVREPRRRRAGHALDGRRGGRHRADRSADRRSGTRDSRGSRWKRAGAPRTAAARATAATRSCAWGGCCTRSSALDRRSAAACRRIR